MLILTRRVDEKLIIGDDVVVTILGTKGNQIRIGVEAPDEVHILRDELLKSDKACNRKRVKKQQLGSLNSV